MSNSEVTCFTFEWPYTDTDPVVNEVIVTGDFDDWSKAIKLDLKRDQGKFCKTIKFNDLKDPNIHFKFIVDGDWLTSPQYKVDNSNPCNNYIEKNELESVNSLAPITSKSDTVDSEFTTISAPSADRQISPPVIVERLENNDDISITNSEATLTSGLAAVSQPTLLNPNNASPRTGRSRGSGTMLSRFKKLFN